MDNVRGFTQAYSQAPWRKQLMFIGLFLLLVVFIALVAGLYLDVTARTATLGREIQIMQRKIDALRMANADLDTSLAYLTSATIMEERARRLGFELVEKDQAQFIVVAGYIPRQQAILAPPPSPVRTIPAALPVDFTESLVEWVQRRLIPQVKIWLEVGG